MRDYARRARAKRERSQRAALFSQARRLAGCLCVWRAFKEQRMEKRLRLNLFMLNRAKARIYGFLQILEQKVATRRYFRVMYEPVRAGVDYKRKRGAFKQWMLRFEK